MATAQIATPDALVGHWNAKALDALAKADDTPRDSREWAALVAQASAYAACARRLRQIQRAATQQIGTAAGEFPTRIMEGTGS
jgi:hypothetical protein